MVLRTLLGIFESAISPGFSLITGMWYTPKEHVSRHSVWFCGNAIAGIIGSMISYGILYYPGDFAKWKVSHLHHHRRVGLSNNIPRGIDPLPNLRTTHRSLGSSPLVLPPGFTAKRPLPYPGRARVRLPATEEVPAHDANEEMGQEAVYRNHDRHQGVVVPTLFLRYLRSQRRHHKCMYSVPLPEISDDTTLISTPSSRP